ncbi:MAG TPA: hypothetical protein VK196_22060 [Magnetospirillum sp.]|nr:hypothetical protein [Magnetospirillum sp.]
MTRAERTRLKQAISGGSILWMVLMGWLMWATLPDNAVETHASDQLKDRMSLCSGTFRDRYDCKEQLIIESGREAFYILSLRFLLVIVPPLAGTLWLSSYLARHPLAVIDEPHHASSGNDDWKARAQLHTEKQSPTEAAEDLHLSTDELPVHPLRSHPRIADIAPVEDWKTRAQANIRKHD